MKNPQRSQAAEYFLYALYCAEMAASFSNTFCMALFLAAQSFSASALSLTDKISIAKSAALTAPSIATVATGIPDGICTVDRRASNPSNVEDFTGIPMTGKVVFAAIAPAKCAALPAAAMMAPNPFSLALSENAFASAGVLCAE
jgi:hypothetical protein